MKKGITNRGTTTELAALAPYLAAIRESEPLSAQEEHDLAARARAGEEAARRELVRRNLALVVIIARQQKRGALRLEELVQEGNLGLLRAAEKFDPDAGTRFSTYAVWWIRAYVWKYLKQARSAVRPRSGTVAVSDVSLDAAVYDEDESSHLDAVEDEEPGPEAAYASAELASRVRASLAQIRGRVGGIGWDVIQHRLRQDPPETLEAIGKRWGVSRERVRQIELATKRILRNHLEPANAERVAA